MQLITMKLTFMAAASLAWQASGRAFLAHLPLNMTRDATDAKFKQALFAELEEILGGDLSSSTKVRVDQIETIVKPMFIALPKNANGKLDHPAVKYVLRRLFMKRQGWALGGLEPTGDSFDPAAASILEERAPELVQELFKKRLGADGSGLHEVAVLAAMMEHLIFEDMLGKLQQSYKALRISPEDVVTRAQAEDLLFLYMGAFVRARDVSEWSPEQVAHFRRLLPVLYPNWKIVSQLMIDVQQRIAPDLDEYTFDDVANVAAEVGSLFAHWQNDDCKGTRQLLHDMEDGQGTGRVSLVNFYNAALHDGKYQFTETINYLRHMGTLDETDELHPKVIIPNYIVGRSNCVARTTYYQVCCLDECEDLFGGLEAKLGKASATVAEITSVVQGFPKWESGLSSLLHRRLEEVAKHHAGLVPLHGRLFAQFMHLAFPNECAYPHKSGTVYYDTMEKWEQETGERSGSTMKQLEQWSSHLASLAESRTDDDRDEDHLSGMWSMEEELVTYHKPVVEEVANSGNGDWMQVWGLRGAGLLGAAGVWVMINQYQSANSPRKGGLFAGSKPEKWCV